MDHKEVSDLWTAYISNAILPSPFNLLSPVIFYSYYKKNTLGA